MNVDTNKILELTIKEAELRFAFDQTKFLNTYKQRYIRTSRKINSEIAKYCRNLINIVNNVNHDCAIPENLLKSIKKDYSKLVKNATTYNYALQSHLKTLTNNLIALYIIK